MGFVDHGPGGTGEPVAALLRPGNAGSNTAADHITATQLALTQSPAALLLRLAGVGCNAADSDDYPGRAVVSQAGSVLLVETVRKAGLATAISASLAPWRKAQAVHHPGKTVLDVALAVTLGGHCLADVGMLRAEPAVFGPVVSNPTVSRLLETLAAAGPKALPAIRSAQTRERSGGTRKTTSVVQRNSVS